MTNRTAIAAIVWAFAAGGLTGAMLQRHADSQDVAQAQSMLGTYTTLPNGGSKYQHVWMPPCPDNLKRTIEAPERDEVDALTVNCQ